MLTPSEMLALNDSALFEQLGMAVKSDYLGALPEEEEAEFEEQIIGKAYFKRQLANIKQIYCNNALTTRLSDNEKEDVDLFVSALLDSFISYYGGWAGTVILVQIYKIGIHKFCCEDLK
jgi:hypothetical protein